MSAFRMTGGCQCGAVRYALTAPPMNPHICHCRMCQKAFGSFFAPLASVKRDQFMLTRGTLAVFKSSDPVERGFCRDCGTPLSLRDVDGDDIAIALGSLDEPAKVEPLRQHGNEGRMPWFDKLPGLAGLTTTTETDAPKMAAAIAASNHQHPDHDTAIWPPKGA
jgi:hypothetical protein